MTLTTETLARYLGHPASALLGDPPFASWIFRRAIQTGRGQRRIDYVSDINGFDVSCFGDERIATIFLYFDDGRRFSCDVTDIPADSSRQQVISLLGSPEKSGEGRVSPILGERGPWDRFSKDGYSIHIEYQVRSNRIRRITLMRADVVP